MQDCRRHGAAIGAYQYRYNAESNQQAMQRSSFVQIVDAPCEKLRALIRSAGCRLLAEFYLSDGSRLCQLASLEQALAIAARVNSDCGRASVIWLMPISSSSTALASQHRRGFSQLNYLIVKSSDRRALQRAFDDVEDDVLTSAINCSPVSANGCCFLVRNARNNLTRRQLESTIRCADCVSFVWIESDSAVSVPAVPIGAAACEGCIGCIRDEPVVTDVLVAEADSPNAVFELVAGPVCRWSLGPFDRNIMPADLESLARSLISPDLLGEVLALPCCTKGVIGWKLTMTMPTGLRRRPLVPEFGAVDSAIKRAAESPDWRRLTGNLPVLSRPRLFAVLPGQRVRCLSMADADWVPLSDAEAAAMDCRYLFVGEISSRLPLGQLQRCHVHRLLPIPFDCLLAEFSRPADCRQALGAIRGLHSGRCCCVHLPDSLQLSACGISLPGHAFLPWLEPHCQLPTWPEVPLLKIPDGLAGRLAFAMRSNNRVGQWRSVVANDRCQFLQVSGLANPPVPLRVLLAYLACCFPAARSVHLPVDSASLTGRSDSAVLRFDRSAADCSDAASRTPPTGLSLRRVRLPQAFQLGDRPQLQLPEHSLLTWLELCQPEFRQAALEVQPPDPPVDERPFLCDCHDTVFES
uniref:Tudor domain-containing protein n=1 Tax=Macrostomum lignano TaxID=282301 RepID=A0A1I8IX18_9PLAT